MTTPYLRLKVQVERERSLIAAQQLVATAAQAEVNAMRAEVNEMLKSCTHDEVVGMTSYTPGGYYDKSYSEQWNQCVLCGKHSEHTINEGGYQ